ncbi:Aldose 1-epimerase [Furfurilactobacillus rossiae]|uniref:aldose epimerase family protein n=1 Tax=Furfurilactobacillus rossiae TaxID=231049 RepID=UPI0015C0F5A5|nr:aldose epimerase family protein [Furfurilactobacillus rossiae]MCF6165105.1 galactose mutarotase [Furfurilactobacillus rossiae]QLE62881.1 Aldose 1-epimerase [Furfurilactobacillus rossiae]
MITNKIEEFDHHNGRLIKKFTLINKRGSSISVLDFGATWYEYRLARHDKTTQNVLLNEPDIAHYLNNPFYLGATIGRVTGRIKNGRFTLGGKQFQLQQNEGATTLHGGPHGFAYLQWEGTILSTDDGDNYLQFSRQVDQSLDGFPGTMTVTVTYSLSEDDTVDITYQAICDTDTLFSPTCHAYFNLNKDNQDIKNHDIKSNAQFVEALDEEHVPNGILAPIDNDMYDYRNFKNVGQAIKSIIDSNHGAGIDDTFLTPAGADVTIRDQESNLTLQTTADRNGVTIFTANGFTPAMQTNKGAGKPFLGIAVEPHILSNAINLEGFGNMILKADVNQTYHARYHVSEGV